MLILHVSDIHFRYPFCESEDDPDLYFRSELVAHAVEQIQTLGDVDAILVTGDIAFCGIRSEYDAASKWLEILATAVGCNKRRIYVVPGNHDVDRNTFDENLAARNAIRQIEQSPNNAARNRALAEQLRNDHTAQHIFASISNYNLFAAKYDCQVFPGRLRWKTTLHIDSRTGLHLYGLNSTIVSGIDNDDHKGDLFMSTMQMSFPRTPGVANLIMAHHPPEWMSDQDQIEMRMLGAPNIVLFGHRHIQALRREHNGPIVFSAGSVNPDQEEAGWEPAYNLIELTSEEDQGQVRIDVLARQFRWQSNPNGFVPKIDMVTKSPIFAHEIPIAGPNNLNLGPHEGEAAGGVVMPNGQTRTNGPPPMDGPDVRDIIYRFWELEPRKRLEVLNELGVEEIPQAAILETMSYRSALVALAKAGRLRELEAAIAKKED